MYFTKQRWTFRLFYLKDVVFAANDEQRDGKRADQFFVLLKTQN